MALVWDFSTLASTTSQMMYMEHETALKQNDTSMPPHGSVRACHAAWLQESHWYDGKTTNTL